MITLILSSVDAAISEIARTRLFLCRHGSETDRLPAPSGGTTREWVKLLWINVFFPNQAAFGRALGRCLFVGAVRTQENMNV
jgi:hypothetical protein